ncbi:MrcB family domain-containing protein [Staphylococcus debuckii]|uniref:MrcB family domain-containing protein n=1 Tax=Staphylococcus debuckii TaxID=2044912 RepID=UPI000F436598|nr:DUF3578 domain-containing protein [Staphylococcus debuckii]AYU54314.1 DUF3578 domain-containing protein [Staphylococcus debuckii]
MKKEQNAENFSMTVKSKREENFKNRYKELVHNLLPLKIRNDIEVDSLKVNGSIGKGRYAQVPWVAIMDPKITTSTLRGYYVVLLFHPEGEGFYLTLNQGWANITEHVSSDSPYSSKDLAKRLSNQLSEKAEFKFTKGSYNYYENDEENKNLNDKAKGYKYGTVFYKYYEKGNYNDDELKSDLEDFLYTYHEIVQKVSYNDYIEMLKQIESYALIEDIKALDNFELEIVEKPKFSGAGKKSTTKVKVNTEEIENNQKENKLVGDKGESIAIQYFKDLTEKCSGTDNKEKLMDMIESVSEKGHGDGYDLIAFDPNKLEDPQRKLIEVKSTTSSAKNHPFYMSSNELWAIKENPNKILIMRLYDILNSPKAYFIDPYEKCDNYESIEDIIKSLFTAEATNYKIIGVK